MIQVESFLNLKSGHSGFVSPSAPYDICDPDPGPVAPIPTRSHPMVRSGPPGTVRKLPRPRAEQTQQGGHRNGTARSATF